VDAIIGIKILFLNLKFGSKLIPPYIMLKILHSVVLLGCDMPWVSPVITVSSTDNI
jgi:hypothetical protein